MAQSRGKEDWLTRNPRPGETCVFPHGTDMDAYPGHPWAGEPSDWKRDALLFDRVYVRCIDPKHPPDIPLDLSFGNAQTELEMESYVNIMAEVVVRAGLTQEELEKSDDFCWDFHLSRIYREAGVMAECTYGTAGLYFRRFTKGEVTAYEGALNNIPIVTADAASWDQIIEFRRDPTSVRKYRDLRLWLRSGLQAETRGSCDRHYRTED